jgi:hypothetical protein
VRLYVQGLVTALGLALSGATAESSPNVSLDEPIYDEIERLRALGTLPRFDSGFYPLSESAVQNLFRSAGVESEKNNDPANGLWLSPLQRLALELDAARDHLRPYSTPSHPRNIAGNAGLTCERREGVPCGNGIGGTAELESALGYREFVSGDVRLWFDLGTADRATDIDLTRAYVLAEVGIISAEVGRDTFALGPAARTQLSWGSNAAPLDHIRFSSRHPWRPLGALALDAQYILGRLRAPQRFPGNLVSIGRVQATVGNHVAIGVTQMLQTEGEGAPQLGVIDFLLEHVRRGDISALQTDSSNRRFGFDASIRIPELQGLRLYYELMFEDVRRARWMDALRYDADHLVGAEAAALGPGQRHGFRIELHQTGVRSQEHGQRSTGFTNAGFAAGSPLGPDAESIYASGRIEARRMSFLPWVEHVQLHSDTYQFIDYGPIVPVSGGVTEFRDRAGLRVRLSLPQELRLEANIAVEHVRNFAFSSGTIRNNFEMSMLAVWYPSRRIKVTH